MNRQVKETWIAALKSGDYTQCNEQLRKIVDGSALHCCLGVLTDLCDKELGDIWSAMNSSEAGYLRYNVTDWAGLPELVENALIRMNDTDGLTFAEIADWIEREL